LVSKGLDPQRDGNIYLATVHGDVLQEATTLHAKQVDQFHPAESMLIELTPAIATHAGPGVLAVAFYQD
jgi:fatty acid-binding protein DegV